MSTLYLMAKSIKSFIADSVTRISSFINSSMMDEKIDNENFYDLGESEEKETVLFDDSLSFSKDIVDTKNVDMSKHDDRMGMTDRKVGDMIDAVSETLDSITLEGSSGGMVKDKNHDGGQMVAARLMDEQHLRRGTAVTGRSADVYRNGSRTNLDVVTVERAEYEMMECRIAFLENELRKESARKMHIDTNHLLSALQEKETKITHLVDQLNKSAVNEEKYKLQIATLEKDLTRANDLSNAFKLMADEKVDSMAAENESLRDQLEFERSKNVRMKNTLKEKEESAKKHAMYNVEMMEYLKFFLDESIV